MLTPFANRYSMRDVGAECNDCDARSAQRKRAQAEKSVMKCTARRIGKGLGWFAILALLIQAGCQSTRSSRSGVASVEPVDAKLLSSQRPQPARTADLDKSQNNGVIQANYVLPSTDSGFGGECSH
jgi:hypothetical protein